ncbi:response regulator [Polyangium sp. 15x6]|uniref:response regulator n=1 Tax=Polyangium sp. 15x6 TaxID=3042687 RepID=UPI00249C191F|nr:response regulator [Polyangium sp. 15x6]MDI3283215.1 response regulator [Polyangium sp. 15x6]
MLNVPTILLLDEEQLMREATALLLTNRGAKVTKAATLDEALAELGHRTYDVAVIDLSNSSPKCVEILQRMRSHGNVPHRVIVTTSQPLPRHESAELAEVIVKPYPFERLLDAVFGVRSSRRAAPRSGVFPLVRRITASRRTAQARRGRV